MALSRLQRAAYALFGTRAARAVARHPDLGLALQRARMPVRPEVHLATATLLAWVAAAASAALAAMLLAMALGGTVSLPLRFFVLVAAGPVALWAGAYLAVLLLPALRSLNRTRDLNAKLPYAINYIATMSAAGATPEELFAGLAEQEVYGEVAEEAAWIVRDVRVMGMDIVTSLQRAIDRTPSARMQDFLQGTVTALTSGGELRHYFAGKSEQFLQDNRQEQRKFLDSLGVLAESFVTVVVAAPLFLIVILSVMTTLGGSPQQVLLLGYVLVLAVIPLAQLGFAWTVRVMTPEA